MTQAVQAPAKETGARHPVQRIALKVLAALAMAAGVTLLMLVLAGVFHPKVPTERASAPAALPEGLQLAEVRLLRRPRYETAVGTVRAVHEAAVASRLLARVMEVRVKAGQPVTEGDVLVRLDDSDLQARLRQAEAAVSAAVAAKKGADADYQRAVRLVPSGGISREELERRETAVRTTTAELDRLQQSAREARVLLDYGTIRAPITGIVIEKRVEAGDTASPGQVLVAIYNPKRMQLIVTVRESLALRLKVGQKVAGRIESLEHDCEATISEIVPEAQAASRSFTVKVTGPCPPGVYSGMFGRIYIPLGDEDVVVVPAAAVMRIGQLDMVRVLDGDRLQRRSIQIGRRLGDDDEVLAGLRPGEKVALAPAGKEARP